MSFCCVFDTRTFDHFHFLLIIIACSRWKASQSADWKNSNRVLIPKFLKASRARLMINDIFKIGYIVREANGFSFSFGFRLRCVCVAPKRFELPLFLIAWARRATVFMYVCAFVRTRELTINIRSRVILVKYKKKEKKMFDQRFIASVGQLALCKCISRIGSRVVLRKEKQ